MIDSKKILIFLGVLFLFVSCSENTNEPILREQNKNEIFNLKINGCWQWISSTGGIVLHTETPKSSNITARLCFDSEKRHYTLYKNNEIIDNDDYTIIWEFHPYFTDYGYMLKPRKSKTNIDYQFMNLMQAVQQLELSDTEDTLTVIPAGADIMISVFVREN